MSIDVWWPRLDDATRQWLSDHNGEAVPDNVADAIGRAGGPGPSDATWSWDEDSGSRAFHDSVVDRIEALANREQ